MNKNDFLNKVFNMATQSTETVISESGQVFESSITDENRRALQALLIDLVNDQTRA